MSSSARAAARIDVERDVAAPMRDGTLLRADVYRPSAGAWPVLVCRTPYGKRGEAFGAPYESVARALAARGYVVVVQDVRGRYASSGEYTWLYADGAAEDHARDGFDTTAWAAGLPGSDGRVGTFGNSYDGYTAMRTAGAAPPALAAAFASGIAARLQDESRGIFEPIYLEWLHGMAADLGERAAWDDDWVRTVPYDALPDEAFGPATAWLRAFLREQEVDRWRLPDTHPHVTVPVCHVTGWWDFVKRGTVANFVSLRANGPRALRDRHRLVIGPWSHEPGALAPGEGAVGYGPDERVGYDALIADWYDFALKGDDPGALADAPIKAFVLNENRWRGIADWPPPDGELLELFLHAGGSLGSRPPVAGAPATFTYDPRDPLPSLADWSTRAVDQAPLDGRRDVVAYLSPPLEQDLLLLGEATCVLWAATDGVETDFTAKLVEVRPDGPAVALAAGILRTRFLRGFETPTVLEPGRPYELVIDLGPVGALLRRGTRLRLDVSSSDFPNFDRNHNTGSDFWSDGEMRPACQTVFNDPEHPSRIVIGVQSLGRDT